MTDNLLIPMGLINSTPPAAEPPANPPTPTDQISKGLINSSRTANVLPAKPLMGKPLING